MCELSAPELKALIASGASLELLTRGSVERPVEDVPLLIEFVAPSSIVRERDRISELPIVGNGPPGTFVHVPQGLRVSLPTDQIVCADDAGGRARIGFGGMAFVGLENGQLVFVRVRELLPEDRLSPARSHRMMLDPRWVESVSARGREVWRAGSP